MEDSEDQLQFYAMLTVTLTLFGGILLKTKTQDEDRYGTTVMAALLVAINSGVVIFWLVQCYLAWKYPSPKVSVVFFWLSLAIEQIFCTS